MKVAILGSGNIGTDLLVKVLRSPLLECTLFVGRDLSSRGILKAQSLGVNVSDQGIQAVLEDPDRWDLVFDATSAQDHLRNWPLLEKVGKKVIDMTPSRIGKMNVPAVDHQNCVDYPNLNMISCGGQAALPLAYLIGQAHDEVNYIEVVSSIASKSAGPATRRDIDDYVETTESALRFYSQCKQSKTILILNPAEPSVHMQMTISAKVTVPNLQELTTTFHKMVKKIQSYVPGYEVIVPPTWETNRIVISIRVSGRGDFLPVYAGNLDIINCAAIATAEEYAKSQVGIHVQPSINVG